MTLSQGVREARRASRTPRHSRHAAHGRTGASPALLRGRYEMGRQVAAGGTARLFRGRDARLDREVAIKVLHPHLLPDAVSRHRIAREAQAAAVLRHPGIAAVYDVADDGTSPAIVMELVDGESLAALLRRRGPMPPAMAAELAAQVADALYHAHRHGIVHRDVKPGNVLVERESGRARLIDFGIAHSLAQGGVAAQLTETGQTLGTPRYMAPEQLAGERIGPRTDLWGLGCLLYEALVGRPSFDGTTPVAISRQQVAGPPNMEGIDPRLAAIIRACLAVSPAERPQDARALAAALRAWRTPDALLTPMLWPDRPPQAESGDAATDVRRTAFFDPRGWGAWGRRLAAVAVLAAMLAAGVVAGTVLRSSPSAEGSPTTDAQVNEAVAPPNTDASPTDTTTSGAGPAKGGNHGGKGNGHGNGGGKGHGRGHD